MLLASGVHPKIASEALGHASASFTLDTYTHVLEGLGRPAADAVQSALGRRRAVGKSVSRAAPVRAFPQAGR
jgi:hypothetical protein